MRMLLGMHNDNKSGTEFDRVAKGCRNEYRVNGSQDSAHERQGWLTDRQVLPSVLRCGMRQRAPNARDLVAPSRYASRTPNFSRR
jgi:hypothetical protein